MSPVPETANATDDRVTAHGVVLQTDDDLDAEVRSSLTAAGDDSCSAASPSSSGRTRIGGESQEAVLAATAMEFRKQEEEPESGKLVSITPDIVKPLKEVMNSEEDGGLLTDDRRRAGSGSSAAGVTSSATADLSPSSSPTGGGGGGLLKSGSSGQLPDMLTHTPDGPQQHQGGGVGRSNSAAAVVTAVLSVAVPDAAAIGEEQTLLPPVHKAGTSIHLLSYSVNTVVNCNYCMYNLTCSVNLFY